MAQRKRHGIRRVVRSWDGFQPAYAAHHVHDLRFFSAAIADDRLLDLKRRVLKNFHARVLTRQQDHSPAVRYGDARGDIRIKKQLLD